MKSIFEILMLVCFGAAWPFSIYKSATAREVGSKSLVFLWVILVGYVAGVINKLTTHPDYVIALYGLNGAMVLTDIALTLRNRLYHVRRSVHEAVGTASGGSAKALIVYASRHGTAAGCARLLAARLPGGADLVDLRAAASHPLDRYDVVFVGGSIYSGRIQPQVVRFCERHRETLLARRVGLFICCLYTGERAKAQLADAFPPWLSSHAFAARGLGGAVHQAALGPLERLMFRRITGIPGDLERIDQSAIEDLAAAVGRPGG